MSEAEVIALPEAGGSCRVQWRRSARARRVSLRICPRQGAVVVVLPPQAARRAGLALLRANAPWALARLAALAPENKLLIGGRVMLGGQDCTIRHDPWSTDVALDGEKIVVGGAAADPSGRVVDFLRAEAQRRIGVLAARHGQALAVQPAAIRVKDTRSRWGSCAPDGTLAFSWRLVMAPDWVLDYAVAHEVAHLREMNHSARFWAHVSRLTPHRDAAAAWLRTHGPTLLRVG